MKNIRIDIFADLVCPWCYIGERRLELALERAVAAHPDLTVTYQWHPFQLHPDLPPHGMPWPQLVDIKFGGMEQARPIFEQVTAIGAGEGLDFRFDSIANAPSTRNAHRLVLLAELSGRAEGMAMALFRAYFTEGRDLNDRATLVMIGRSVGLEEAELEAYLESEVGLDEVKTSQEEAEKVGIGGVPFYIFDGRYAISGAQPAELFDQAIAAVLSDEDAPPADAQQ